MPLLQEGHNQQLVCLPLVVPIQQEGCKEGILEIVSPVEVHAKMLLHLCMVTKPNQQNRKWYYHLDLFEYNLIIFSILIMKILYLYEIAVYGIIAQDRTIHLLFGVRSWQMWLEINAYPPKARQIMKRSSRFKITEHSFKMCLKIWNELLNENRFLQDFLLILNIPK